MRLYVPLLAVLWTLIACGTRETILPTHPRITSFTAAKTRISSGESVALAFQSDGATEAGIIDQTGTSILIQGSATSGTATVSPRSTTVYVLRVRGEGGSDTAFVRVAVDEDLQDAFLAAVPTRIESGQSVQLLWSAFHADQVSLRGSDGTTIDLDASKGSGFVELTPARSASWVLEGTRADGQAISASAEVKVSPVIVTFEAIPAAAKAGDTLTLHWKTAGAGEVALSEATFGELTHVAYPGEGAGVDETRFAWTVPQVFPNQQPVTNGAPLRFTLTVKQEDPAVTLTQTLESFVGEGPRILEFTAPQFVTEGKKVRIGWRTARAERLQILENGQVVYEPLPANVDGIAKGTLTLNAPAAQATYQLIAWGHEGTQVTAQTQAQLVKAPAVDSFTLPASVGALGASAQASWTTRDATSVTIRVKNGPVVFSSSSSQTASAGTAELFPGTRSTFVLEAWNAAGDSATAEASVDVSFPAAFSASPGAVSSGDPTTVSWTFDPAILIGVVGVPGAQPVKTTPSTGFVELRANGTNVLLMDGSEDGVVRLPLIMPFRFPFLERIEEDFYVSPDGFVAFDPAGALPSQGAMIAPFWADLGLGAQGQILYSVEGNTFPRRLIIEWSKVQTLAQDELTFEVQLFETGEFRFIYKTLEGNDALGDGAMLGWRAHGTSALSHSQSVADLSTGDELDFFTDTLSAGHFDLTPSQSGTFTLFGRTATGPLVAFPARLNVVIPGSVVVNEVMAMPDADPSYGQWVELANVSRDPVDLSGTTLVSQSTSTSCPLPEGTVLEPGKFLVVGQDPDSSVNGGVSIDLVCSGLKVDKVQGDTLSLIATHAISELVFDSADLNPLQSIVARTQAIDSVGNRLVCPSRTATFGPHGALGTPGAKNDPCHPYVLTSIPEDWEDISGFGTPLFFRAGLLGVTNAIARVDLSSAPFNFYGVPRQSIWVDVNGELAFADPGLSKGDYHPTTPGGASPWGMLAPFWMHLATKSFVIGSQVYAAHLPASSSSMGRWIIHYAHVAFGAEDLNFEVKLFDDGTIEYHYAEMLGASSTHYNDGNAATIWLGSPDFSSAIPIGINQPVIRPHTAYRFAPIR